MSSRSGLQALGSLVVVLLAGSPAVAGEGWLGEDVRLTFEAEALWLDRSDPGGFTISAIDGGPGNGTEVLSMDDLEFDRDLGGRVTLGLHRGRDSLELVHLRVHRWTDRDRETDSAGRIDSFFANETVGSLPVDPVVGFRNASFQQISYETELDSVELNYRRRFVPARGARSSLLAGFRHVRIDEDFDLASRGSTGLGSYEIATENDLYGLQVGGAAEQAFSVLRFGAELKGGIFANRIGQESRIHVNQAGSLFRFDTDRSGTAFGTLLEAGVEVALDLPLGVSLTAGYEVVRASGLALAPDHIAGKCCFGVLDILSRDGSALYHGPRVGMEVAFGGRPAQMAAGSAPGAPLALEQGPAGDSASSLADDELRVSFRAEAVWLQRGDPDGSALTVFDSAAGCTGVHDGCRALGVGDLSFQLEGAGRWTAGASRGRHGLEVVYLGLADWTDTQAVSGATDPDSILEDVNVTIGPVSSNDPFDNAFGGVRASYGTRLDSAELNYRRPLAPWQAFEPTFLAGLRYVGIEETFRFRAFDSPQSTGNHGLYAIDTDNHLFGAQLGLEVQRSFELGPGALRIGVRAKGALLANDVHQDSSIFVRPVQVVDSGAADVELGNLVEAGLVLAIDLPFGISLVGGYDTMRVGGLALATDQISPTFALGGFDDLDTEGSAFYHGPWVGMELAFQPPNPFD